MPKIDNLQPIGDPLGIAAIELLDLARLADRLEGLLADLAGRCATADPNLLKECQIADLLSQRLVGVSAFLAALAAAAPRGAKVDVSDAVRGLALSDQARCLAALAPDAPCAAAAGELTLFED
jgi:hypothetical protein